MKSDNSHQETQRFIPDKNVWTVNNIIKQISILWKFSGSQLSYDFEETTSKGEKVIGVIGVLPLCFIFFILHKSFFNWDALGTHLIGVVLSIVTRLKKHDVCKKNWRYIQWLMFWLWRDWHFYSTNMPQFVEHGGQV